jgi:hypothetical protein
MRAGVFLRGHMSCEKGGRRDGGRSVTARLPADSGGDLVANMFTYAARKGVLCGACRVGPRWVANVVALTGGSTAV